MKKKVYVVMDWTEDNQWIVGVFSSWSKAEIFCEEYKGLHRYSPRIEEWDVD